MRMATNNNLIVPPQCEMVNHSNNTPLSSAEMLRNSTNKIIEHETSNLRYRLQTILKSLNATVEHSPFCKGKLVFSFNAAVLQETVDNIVSHMVSPKVEAMIKKKSFSKERQYFEFLRTHCNRVKANWLGDQLVMIVLGNLFQIVLNMECMSYRQRVQIYLDLFINLLAMKIQYHQSRQHPLIPHSCFVKAVKFKQYAQNILQTLGQGKIEWIDKEITRSKVDESGRCVFEYIKDPKRAQGSADWFSGCLVQIKSSLLTADENVLSTAITLHTQWMVNQILRTREYVHLIAYTSSKELKKEKVKDETDLIERSLMNIPYLGHGWSSSSDPSENQITQPLTEQKVKTETTADEQSDTHNGQPMQSGRKRKRTEFEDDQKSDACDADVPPIKAEKVEEVKHDHGTRQVAKASLCSATTSMHTASASTIRLPALAGSDCTRNALDNFHAAPLPLPTVRFCDVDVEPIICNQASQVNQLQAPTNDFSAELMQLLCESVAQAPQDSNNVGFNQYPAAACSAPNNQSEMEELARFLLQQTHNHNHDNLNHNNNNNNNSSTQPMAADNTASQLANGALLNNYGNIVNNHYQIVTNNHPQVISQALNGNGASPEIPPLIEAVCDGPNCAKKTCEDGSTLLLCGRCLNARYCSRHCQFAKLNEHRAVCDFFYQARKTLNTYTL